jgi:hypothetical protein
MQKPVSFADAMCVILGGGLFAFVVGALDVLILFDWTTLSVTLPLVVLIVQSVLVPCIATVGGMFAVAIFLKNQRKTS